MARPIALFFCMMLSACALAQGDSVAISHGKSLAITHVTVIDATGAAPQRDMTVLIGSERIQALGRTGELAVPANARAIDAAGKFLIPGLWDMHVHWSDERYLKLFIANGVTGIRVMWGYPRHLEQRTRIADGSLIGPRLALAGTIIDGPKRSGRSRSRPGLRKRAATRWAAHRRRATTT